ncbi:MAG TPA: DnaJ family domain-containing protein [Sporolactobacillaceae bacterium]|nr:DnaJ family domain-containing protein [Sporolactobacillaceae bacterium]
MDIFALIAEDKIKTAIKKGELDNLPGKGKPLQLDDLAGVPEDLRMGYRLLKNAGFFDEEAKLGRDIMHLTESLKSITNPEDQKRIRDEISEKRTRFEKVMDERKLSQSKAYAQYRDKLRDKI